MAGVKCGKCHARHATVDDVKACYQEATTQPTPTAPMPVATGGASPKQAKFIRDLWVRKGMPGDVEAVLAALPDGKTASNMIDALKGYEDAEAKAKPEPVEMTEDELMAQIGVFILPDGTIVQVKPNKQKTRCYAKRWISINGERLTLSDEHVKGEWAYAPGLMAKVKPEYRMTVEQAKRFILIYGQCARCGRKLKAAKSVEQGIGPVCIKYFGGALALA